MKTKNHNNKDIITQCMGEEFKRYAMNENSAFPPPNWVPPRYHLLHHNKLTKLSLNFPLTTSQPPLVSFGAIWRTVEECLV